MPPAARGYDARMMLPKPRGDVSEWVFERLRAVSDEAPGTVPDAVAPMPSDRADAAVALWSLHELSYSGFEDVSAFAEQDPVALVTRAALERDLEQRLRDRWPVESVQPGDVPARIVAMVEADEGPSLAAYVHRRADRDQVLGLLQQRSVYHLKEADPSTWTVPRLPVRAKAALVELQFDEYGAGNPNRLHSHLFARGLDAIGLRPDRGAYVDDALPQTLEMNNAISLFGLQRRLRGASMGHLAAFEATSSQPSHRMVQGMKRLGFAEPMLRYYSEHIEADAVHEHLAARDICGTLAEDDPQQAAEVVFGVFTCLDLEARFATAMFAQWGIEP